MLIIVKTILFLLGLVLVVMLALCVLKLRKLVAWRFSNAYTQEDMAYFHEVLLDVKSTDDPVEFMKRHTNYRTYKILIWFTTLAALTLALLSIGFDVSLRLAQRPTEERIAYCEELVRVLYSTHPNNLKKVWDEELKSKIDSSISYRLDPTSIENLAQRHRLLNASKTKVEFKGWFTDDNNEILLWYKIISPTVTETRQMQFLFDEEGLIIELHEYKEPEFSVTYIMGAS